MAKRHPAKDPQRKNPFLPDPDEYDFDDDLDSVTRNLPTEEDYLPHEEAETPAEAPLTEGISRTGVRMIGLKPSAAELPAEEGFDFTPADDLDVEDDDLTARRRSARNVPEDDVPMEDELDAPAPVTRTRTKKQQRLLFSQEEKEKSKQARGSKLRLAVLISVTALLLLIIGMMLLSRTMMPDNALLQAPEEAVSTALSPVQGFFSGIVDDIADYFRRVKLRDNLEQAYVDLLSVNEELYIQAALTQEYADRLAMYEDIDEEMQQNLGLNPIRCQVIGREQGNYFSTFTINHGSRDGLEPYMAVTLSGSLVGFTEEVYETTATVRTIIDSNASISGLIQSSRDQGIVSGTLGITGEALCRMYYLPDDHLPRPGDVVVTSGVGMSFPKGIPIGTVRESTRGMESNKQYIVVEPSADFEHIEYVIVYRYKPAAEAVEGRDTTSTYNEYVATATARPYPTLRIGSTLRFGETATPAATATLSPTPSVTATATPTPTLTPTPTPATSVGPALEYQSSLLGPTPTPTPSPTPSPTPVITIDPDNFTWEEE